MVATRKVPAPPAPAGTCDIIMAHEGNRCSVACSTICHDASHSSGTRSLQCGLDSPFTAAYGTLSTRTWRGMLAIIDQHVATTCCMRGGIRAAAHAAPLSRQGHGGDGQPQDGEPIAGVHQTEEVSARDVGVSELANNGGKPKDTAHRILLTANCSDATACGATAN
jgi:hypothetical protein